MENDKDTVKPLVRWRYSDLDGPLKNNTGDAIHNNPIPAGLPTHPKSYLNPYNFYDYYGFGKIRDDVDKKGYGQKIAIVNAYGNPNMQNDLNFFCSSLNLPTKNITTYHPAGFPTSYDSSWALETSLDVQYCHAMAISATIMLVISPDNGFLNLRTCIQYAVNVLKADIVSMSYGAEEFSSLYTSGYDNVYANLSAVYIAASGDWGAQVLYPGSSPHVLSVGGTTLSGGNVNGYFQSTGPYGEVGWSGSGGGISTINNLPSYQSGWSTYSKRSVPDVSYNAGAYAVVYHTDPVTNSVGWIPVGGTSAGTPQWASIVARMFSSGIISKNKSIINSILYNLATSNYSNYYFDILKGSNGYNAYYGYDLVSGLGSPKVDKFLPPPTTNTPTPTRTPTRTPTVTPTPKITPSGTPTNTPSKSIYSTPTVTPTKSSTPRVTPSITVTKTVTRTVTKSTTPTWKFPKGTPSNTPTQTKTPNPTPIASRRPIASRTPSRTPTRTPTKK